MIRLDIELTRFGELNELCICYGSVFAPFKRSAYRKYDFFPGNALELDSYLRTAHFNSDRKEIIGYTSIDSFDLIVYKRTGPNPEDILPDVDATFIAQVNEIIPHFEKVIFPLLQLSDSLEDYASKAERLLELRVKGSGSLEHAVIELAYIYLYLGKISDAQRLLEKYIAFCKAKIEQTESEEEERDKQYELGKKNMMETLKKSYQNICLLHEDIQTGHYPPPQLSDSSENYVYKAIKLLEMRVKKFEPGDSGLFELVYASIYSGKVHTAQRLLEKHIAYQKAQIEQVKRNEPKRGKEYEDSKRHRMETQKKNYQNLCRLYEDIRTGNWKKHEPEMMARQTTSHDLMVQFFGLKEK